MIEAVFKKKTTTVSSMFKNKIPTDIVSCRSGPTRKVLRDNGWVGIVISLPLCSIFFNVVSPAPNNHCVTLPRSSPVCILAAKSHPDKQWCPDHTIAPLSSLPRNLRPLPKRIHRATATGSQPGSAGRQQHNTKTPCNQTNRHAHLWVQIHGD